MNTARNRILIFLISALVLGYSVSFFLMSKGGLSNANATAFLCIIMCIPACAVILSQFFTREGFRNPYLKLKINENPSAFFISYFLIQILVVIGAVVYFLIFSKNFDPGLTKLLAIAEQQGREINQSGLYSNLVVTISFQFLSGPFANLFFAFCEEYGWRGYLLPKLCEVMSPLKSTILTGAVRGVFYAPMIAMGYKYDSGYFGAPFTGILAMIAYCIIISVIMSYFTLKTKSVFPAVLMHSALDTCSSTAQLLDISQNPNPFIGPAPTGIIGGIGFIICGLVCAALLRKEKTT